MSFFSSKAPRDYTLLHDAISSPEAFALGDGWRLLAVLARHAGQAPMGETRILEELQISRDKLLKWKERALQAGFIEEVTRADGSQSYWLAAPLRPTEEDYIKEDARRAHLARQVSAAGSKLKSAALHSLF